MSYINTKYLCLIVKLADAKAAFVASTGLV